MAFEQCIFCDNSLEESDVVLVSKGLETICRVSIELKDGISDKLRDRNQLLCHKRCRINYVLKRHGCRLQGTEDQETANKKLKSSAASFDFKTSCIFCCKECDFLSDKKMPVKRRQIHEVKTTDLLNSIRSAAASRCDTWGADVMSRLENVNSLVETEGRYHQSCFSKFFHKLGEEGKRGRPANKSYEQNFADLVTYMKECEDRQFTLSELQDILLESNKDLEPEIMSCKTLRRKLQEHFGSDLIMSELPGKKTVVSLLETGHKILYDAWDRQPLEDPQHERLRVVKAAADIIREDILTCVFDTESYDTTVESMIKSEEKIPRSLQILLTEIICKRKSKEQNLKKKITVLGHQLLSLVRPRTFLSVFQVGLGVYLHRQYASRKLIDLLFGMGMSCSYDEVLLYEKSAMNRKEESIDKNSLIQFVFDNADFNVRTLDGHGTFHAMGGIMCITPRSNVKQCQKIMRFQKNLEPNNVTDKGAKCLTYMKKRTSSQELCFGDIKELEIFSSESVRRIHLASMMWMLNAYLNPTGTPQWAGFMSQYTSNVTGSSNAVVASTKILPFIDLPPNSFDAVFSSLMYAVTQCKHFDRKSCIVTFDQPLYAKAAMIIADNPDLMSGVVLRLGGFHLLISFLGAVGYIMSGSGIEHLWSLIYANNSIDKMLSGHAFARALRAHFLTQLAIAQLVLDKLVLEQPVISETSHHENKTILGSRSNGSSDDLFSDGSDELGLNDTTPQEMRSQFEKELCRLSDSSRTSRLWCQ